MKTAKPKHRAFITAHLLRDPSLVPLVAALVDFIQDDPACLNRANLEYFVFAQDCERGRRKPFPPGSKFLDRRVRRYIASRPVVFDSLELQSRTGQPTAAGGTR
jgi:hypothetical protein